jgi:hypothetical protein
MSFIRVRWKHSIRTEPVLLYSELDCNRFEVRKVEVWADGRCGYADAREEMGGSKLGLAPVPSTTEVAKQQEFEPAEITSDEFEAVWSNRKNRPRDMISLGDDEEAKV